MLAGFLLGIVHDRKLMREAQVNLAIRWFAGYRLHESLPHHSSLTRLRQRWGESRFRDIFERTARNCVEAGIADGEVVHVDATLIRANVSWESLVADYAGAAIEENATTPEPARRRSGKRVSVTDPDASLATADRRVQAQPSYKQHTAVDDRAGVVLDVELTTGGTNEGDLVEPHLKNVSRITGRAIGCRPRMAATPTPRRTKLPSDMASIRSFHRRRNHRRSRKCRYVDSAMTPSMKLCVVRPASGCIGRPGRRMAGFIGRWWRIAVPVICVETACHDRTGHAPLSSATATMLCCGHGAGNPVGRAWKRNFTAATVGARKGFMRKPRFNTGCIGPYVVAVGTWRFKCT